MNGTEQRGARGERHLQTLLLFVVMVLLGFTVMNHFQLVRRRAVNPSYKSRYLAYLDQLDNLQQNQDRLILENKTLTETRSRMYVDVLARHGEDDTLAEIETYRKLAGFTDVEGPGVQVTLNDKPGPDPIRDPDSVIHDLDILAAIDLLINAGAGAISVNDQRITVMSAFSCGGPTIQCNRRTLSPPFVIRAIGDPATLANALRGSAWLQRKVSPKVGAQIKVEEQNKVTVLAFADQDNLASYINLLERRPR